MSHASTLDSPPRLGLLRWALICMPAVLLLGMATGSLAGSSGDDPWFAALEKPAFYPPAVAFPIVWTILYLMLGLALAMVCATEPGKERASAIKAFLVQFALNLAWSPTFFGAQWIGLGLAVLLAIDVAAVITFVLFWRVRRKAAVLLVPYLAWLAFATLLNWRFLVLNS